MNDTKVNGVNWAELCLPAVCIAGPKPCMAARVAAGPGLLRGAAGLSPAPDVLVVRHQPAGTYTANIALDASTLACLL